MYQLWVYFQYFGYFIQNDLIYVNQWVWGMSFGYNDVDGMECVDEDVISWLLCMGKEEVVQVVVYYDEMVDEYEK